MSGRADFHAWLTATTNRRRRAAVWRAAAASLAAVASAFALAAATDRLMAPAGWPLVAVAFASLMVAAALAAILVLRARRPEEPSRIVAMADTERPEFQDRAKTALDLVERPEAGIFDDLVLAETTRQVGPADLPVTTDEAGARRGMRLAAASALALIIALAAAWPTLRDAGTTARVLMFPGSLALTVEPGDIRVPIGKSVTIVARASTLPRSNGLDVPMLAITSEGASGEGAMTATSNGFSYVTPPVISSFTYKVSLGPAVTREYKVEAVPFPQVKAIDLSYRYPEWSGLDAREEKDGGDVYGPEGTKVRLQVQFDKPAKQAALLLADGSRVALTPGKTGAFETTLTLAKDNSYRVEVVDVDDLTNDESTEYFIRLMDDAPPDVRIVKPAGDQRVTALAEVAIEAKADDDHGVRALELVYSVRGQSERVVPLGGGLAKASNGGDAREVAGRHLIYLEDLGVKPGDFVSFYARARDIARGKASTEGRSDIFFLEVKPFEEEFAAAQSMAQAGAGAASRQLGSLAAAQKEIIVATWKLERRSFAGKSDADIKAVAQAQRELRQRAAQAGGQAIAPPQPQGRRGGGRRGQAPPPGSTGASAPVEEEDANALLARAGEAMERAAAELDASKPKTALDHENAALNDLLKIEAQVRRREIMQSQQQANGGGGGGQSGNQDLSALFDRELQRQQQTNYENRANERAAEQQNEQQQESEALRRVKEMAQRQEAIRREQERLARANLTAEERKRQLERLRRDQEQLQREVEQLAQKLDQQRQQQGQQGQQQSGQQQGQQQGRQQGQQQGQQSGQQSGQQGQQAGQQGQQGSQSGQQQGQGSGARSAADAMSQAAGSMGREDLERASEQSAKASEALRNLEREMRDRERGGQSRSMNEARLEAQQLAEAQRRLADDARAAARDGATPDASRRLAGEKERLAERLEALGRRLDNGQQGNEQRRQPGSNQADQLARDAAATSRRMAREQRAGAENWRNAGQAGQAGRAGQAGSTGQTGQTGQPGQPGQAGQAGNSQQREAAGMLADGESRMAADLEQLARRLGAPPSGSGEADTRRLANELDEARATRERIADLERQINQLRREAEAGGNQNQGDNQRRLNDLQRDFSREAERARELAQRGNDQRGGADQRGNEPRGADQRGGSDQRGSADQRGGGDRAGRDNGRQEDGRGSTPEEAWSPSRSAPGTQQWKQDFSKWESMRKDVAHALEKYEASLTSKLAEKLAAERVHGGYDARTPEAWRKLVADYYEAIARRRR